MSRASLWSLLVVALLSLASEASTQKLAWDGHTAPLQPFCPAPLAIGTLTAGGDWSSQEEAALELHRTYVSMSSVAVSPESEGYRLAPIVVSYALHAEPRQTEPLRLHQLHVAARTRLTFVSKLTPLHAGRVSLHSRSVPPPLHRQ